MLQKQLFVVAVKQTMCALTDRSSSGVNVSVCERVCVYLFVCVYCCVCRHSLSCAGTVQIHLAYETSRVEQSCLLPAGKVIYTQVAIVLCFLHLFFFGGWFHMLGCLCVCG